MKSRLLACAVVALVPTFALVSPAAAADWGTETEHFSRTVPLEPGGTLRLKSFSGRVNITAGDTNDVVIEAVRRATRERLDRIHIDVHKEGAAVVIDANRRDSTWWWASNNVVETDFDIKVPHRTDIDVQVFSAPVTIDGVDGNYTLHGFSSRFTIDNSTGSVRAHTFSGPISIRTTTWRNRPTVDVDTFSGNITLHVPGDARGELSFNSFSGRLASDVPLTLRGGNRRSLKADLGPASTDSSDADRGRLRFKTFSGPVKIVKIDR